MEDDLKKNGRQTQKNNGRQPKQSKKEDELKQEIIFSRFLLNLGATLSWGWLSSLRFFQYKYTSKTMLEQVNQVN